MGETTIDPADLEDAVRKVLQCLLPSSQRTTGGTRQEFYDKFQREASEHDRDFTEKYGSDFNNALILAGLLSAVTSAFIIATQTSLQPDYTQLSYGLLQIIANVSLGHTQTGPVAIPPQWPGPVPNAIRVQAALYASLGVTLLAVFLVMLGKWWLEIYSKTEKRGSLIDRCRDRQRKMDGLDAWQFDLVMQCFPPMFQIAIILLCCALSGYLFSINKALASVTIGYIVFGGMFYFQIVSAGVFSDDCPFQTPFSLNIRRMFRLKNERRKKRQPNVSLGDHVELPMTNGPPPAPLFVRETDLEEYVLDSKCIARMFQMSIDADTSIMRFIPEIVWHAGIQTTPLEKLYDTMLECFDQLSGHLMVIPKFKEKAYLSAKALVHLAIQRKCFGNDSDKAALEAISNRHLIMGSEHYEGKSDLESTLGIADRVFSAPEPVEPDPKRPGPMRWEKFSFSGEHHAWMGHILLYRAWDTIRRGKPLPDDTKEFVLHSLRLEPPPPAPIVADCLFIVGLVLGIELCIDDLLVVDKSRQVNPQINRIFEKLNKTFENPDSNPNEIDLVLGVTKLVTPLSNNDIAQKSYDLFHVVMQAPVSPAYSQERKWNASRLAMHGAYKWNQPFPLVDDPRDLLTFLVHHFDMAIGGDKTQDEPIQDALCTLAYASDPAMFKDLKDFDPTKPSFVRGICYTYQDKRPSKLRKAALFFLPLISDKMFNTPEPIIEPDEMKSFCADWASTVDSLELTPDVQKAALTVLLGMINSPHWHPHIITEKWRLLEHFTLIPDDSQPLRRCIDNPDLIEVVRNVDDQAASFLWLRILWLKYQELIPEVRTQLENVTREVGQGERRADLDKYLETMDSELKKAKEASTQNKTLSKGPDTDDLQTRIENLQAARSTLVVLKRG